MANIDAALDACRDATNQLIAAAEASSERWAVPCAPGKWSPSQIVEHVARSLEESANVAAGRPSKFPNIPAVIRPLLRHFVFRRCVQTSTFPKGGRASRKMNPSSLPNPSNGPATPEEGRIRLETAQRKLEDACREFATRDGVIRSSIFGPVPAPDYVRFMELHTRHHRAQIDQGPTV
jgi:hypothetical protein